MARTMFTSLLLGLATLNVGCSYIHDAAIAGSNRAYAEFSWHSEGKKSAAALPYWIKQHFGLGYIAGYEAVAAGGKGELPLFPPQCYWSPKYRTVDGREKVAAWFEGYQQGASAAFADGMSGINKLPTSRAPVRKPSVVHSSGEVLPDSTVPPLDSTPQAPKLPVEPAELLPPGKLLESKAEEPLSLIWTQPFPAAVDTRTNPQEISEFFAAFSSAKHGRLTPLGEASMIASLPPVDEAPHSEVQLASQNQSSAELPTSTHHHAAYEEPVLEPIESRPFTIRSLFSPEAWSGKLQATQPHNP